MVDFNTVVSDPDFYRLPMAERKKVLATVAPEFTRLPEQEQMKVMQTLESRQTPSVPNQMTASRMPEIAMGAAHTQMQASAGAENAFNKLAGVRESILGTDSGISAQAVAPASRMLLETGGFTAGALAGTPGGVPGMLAGGALGYSGAKTLSDLIEEATGVRKPQAPQNTIEKWLDPVGGMTMDGQPMISPGGTVDRLTKPVRDAIGGFGMGVAGETLAQGVVASVDAGRGIIRWMKAPVAMSERAAGKKAGEYLVASTSDGPIYAQNADEARKIEEIINAGAPEGTPQFKFTLGERSFDPNQIKAQQVIDLPQGKGATLRAEHYDANDQALRSYFQRNFSGEEGVADVQGALSGRQELLGQAQQGARQRVASVREGIPTTPPDQAGQEALGAIEEAKAPVRQAMNELGKAIPDYPMKFENLKTEIELIKRDKSLDINVRRAIENFEKNDLPDLLKNGETTQAARGINSTLGNLAEEYKKANKRHIGYVFDRLRKSGLQPDIDAISDLARTGKIVEWNGKAVDADQLAGQVETNLTRLAEMKASQTIDLDALKQGIKDAGGRVRMQVVRESDDAYRQSLAKDYKNLTGNDPPVKMRESPEAIQKLEARIAQDQKILSEISPGQDVGATMSAYNRYASKEWFGRFDKGAVKDVTAKGNQATGTKLRIEQIPARFKTPQGASDLITAVGPEKAREVMRGNLSYDLLQSATDANGAVNATKLKNWLVKNKLVLDKYGMADDFKTLQAAQDAADKITEAAVAFEKSAAGKLLGVDSDKVVKQIVEGNKTASQMAQVLQTLKGDKTAVKGLKNSFGQWVVDNASTTWKALSENKPTVSMAQFSRTMKKSMEAARVLYRDEPQKIQALQTMQRAYEITFRSSRAPAGVGSPTAEKMANLVAKNTIDMVSSGSTSVRAAKAFWNFMGRMRQNKIDDIIAQAIYDPDYAYMLIRGSKGQLGDLKAIEREVNGKVIRLDDYRKRSQTMLVGTEASQQQGD